MGHPALKIERAGVSLEEFRRMQKERPERLEYFEGHVLVGMAGTRRYHRYIVGNISRHSLGPLRKRGCSADDQTAEVRTPDGEVIIYPDIVVHCPGENPPNDLVVYDPVAIIEVLSESTRFHDRVRKFAYCDRIPSLRHYVLVEQEVMKAEHRSRPDAETEWTTRDLTRPEDRLAFPEVPFDLSLAEIYADIPV